MSTLRILKRIGKLVDINIRKFFYIFNVIARSYAKKKTDTDTKKFLKIFGVMCFLYVFLCVLILIYPHEINAFGKMNLHQVYASLGNLLSFGLFDLTLVDWYMESGTKAVVFEQYDKLVSNSIIWLSPIYILWLAIMSWVSVKLWRKIE